MADREKVIRGLEICSTGHCEISCPFHNVSQCTRAILSDALILLKEQEDLGTELTNAVELIHKKNERIEKLLKEQEAKNVVNMTLSKDKFLIASCPKCNALLTRVEHKNYCGYCGQAVKWE